MTLLTALFGRKKGLEMQRETGTVKWFSDIKSFGFVTPDNGVRDLFLHYSGIAGTGFRTVSEGDRVEFEVEESDRGPKAVNLVVTKPVLLTE